MQEQDWLAETSLFRGDRRLKVQHGWGVGGWLGVWGVVDGAHRDVPSRPILTCSLGANVYGFAGSWMQGKEMLRNREDSGSINLTSFSLLASVLSILTDSGGGLPLTPLILYAGSHSLVPSIYPFLFLPPWLTRSCRSIKLIKGSILSWSPLANTSANQ